MIKDYKNKT